MTRPTARSPAPAFSRATGAPSTDLALHWLTCPSKSFQSIPRAICAGSSISPGRSTTRPTTRSGCRRCASPCATRSTRKPIRSIKTADRQLFLALRDGKPVGRIAAIENRAHNEFHKDRVGFFGFFECMNDQEAANALFAAAETWLTSRGLDTMRGPMNPSTNHECGMLVGGFGRHPMIMTTWNPRYYPTLVEAAGFAKAKDLLAYFFPMQGERAFEMPER